MGMNFMTWNKKLSRAVLFFGFAFSINDVFAEPSWYLSWPRGKSVVPYTGFFVNSQVAYAVKNPHKYDTADAILKSVDGGVTWNPLASGPSLPLMSIQFPRVKVGYVLATNGITLLKTLDAGENWSRWDADHQLDRIDFINDTVGFAAPDSGGLLISLNGGKEWIQYPIPKVKPELFYFGSERVGFISPKLSNPYSDSTLAITKNWGDQWEWILGAPKLEKMAFLNTGIGFATGIKKIAPNDSEPVGQTIYGVYKSTDSGSTWKAVISNHFSEQGFFWKYQNPLILNSELGYVIANKFDTSGAIPGARILKTINGGNTWTIDFETGEMHLFDLQFPENGRGFVKASSVTGNPQIDTAILIKYSPEYNMIPVKTNRGVKASPLTGHPPSWKIGKYFLLTGRVYQLSED